MGTDHPHSTAACCFWLDEDFDDLYAKHIQVVLVTEIGRSCWPDVLEM